MDNILKQREVFHLSFLAWLVRSLPPTSFALKGGVNLRIFFDSPRYSEDMDIDVLATVPMHQLTERVMHILGRRELVAALLREGIKTVVPPDLTKAKQTETVQRFKVHLITTSGLDLFTKIEFSRRGPGKIIADPIPSDLARQYLMTPFILPHYGLSEAFLQKVRALLQRTVPQPRDIFDIYILMHRAAILPRVKLSKEERKTAIERTLSLDYDTYYGGVLEYLGEDDKGLYGSEEMWNGIQLKVAHLLEGK